MRLFSKTKADDTLLLAIHEEAKSHNKNLTDVLEICLDEFGKFAEERKAEKQGPVNTETMLKAVQQMYVESVNSTALLEAGYRQLITAILMKVGDLHISKEMQAICNNKTFGMKLSEHGDVHLYIQPLPDIVGEPIPVNEDEFEDGGEEYEDETE